MSLIVVDLNETYLKQLLTFECNNPYLEMYIKNKDYAFEHAQTGETKTFLLIDKATNFICAYTSIKCSSLRIEEQIDDRTEIEIYPSVEIAMLAVDSKLERKGIGTKFLLYIINHINSLRKLVGVRAITLFAVPDKVEFYKKSKFKELVDGMDMYLHPSCDGCTPMYLALPRQEI